MSSTSVEDEKTATAQPKEEDEAPKKRPGRPPKAKTETVSENSAGKQREQESALKDSWEAEGKAQASRLDAAQATLPDNLSVACGVSLFLQTLKGQSVQTHKTYRVGCRVFLFFLHETDRGNPAQLPVVSLPPLILEDYYLWLVERYSRAKKMTVAGYMAGPRNLFAYLARRDITPSGVQYAKITGGLSRLAGRSSYKTPRVDYSETRKLAEYMYNLPVPPLPSLTVNEAETKEKDAEDTKPSKKPQNIYAANRRLSVEEIALRRLEFLRDRAIILTLYTTGMRREEVSRLNRADVQDGRSEEALITGKGDKERVVFFDTPTLKVVREYLVARNDNYQPLFIQHRTGRGMPKAGGSNFRLSPFSVWAVVQKWAKEVGVTVRPHDFRHALATTMLNSGAQLGEVQDVLGHASPVTTKMIYAHYERKTLRAAVNKHRISVGQAAQLENTTDSADH
jgi:site-specific recombinase XerD